MSSTDTAEESTEICLSPPRKRTKKYHFDIKTKESIFNMYEHETKENPTLIIDEIVNKVANKIGVCGRSVYKIIREYTTNHTFSAPKTNQNRKKNVDLVEDFYRNAIRRIVHQYFFKNKLPTLDKVLKDINEAPDLPSFKRTTFYRLLRKLNFKYQKQGKNSLLLDRDEIVLWRREYLQKIKSYRNENRKIYFLDETWVNAGQTKSKIWVNKSVTSTGRAFFDGLSTRLKNPSGNGKRLIVCHIGSDEGFVPEALWTFESKKNADYHEEINGIAFEKWFENILSKLNNNCIVVLDSAPYHSRKLERIPTTASRKSEIQDWLRSKNIQFEETLLKVQLLAIVKEHRKKYDKYIIDEMARAQNKIVLRIPPYHCELNPIELIWADMKKKIPENITTSNFADMKNIFHKAIATITPEKWKECIDHVQQTVEPKMWKLDNIMEQKIEQFVINVNYSDTSSDELEEQE